jgi:kelch-like protein 20
MDVVRDCSPSRPKLSKVSERHPQRLLEQISQLRRSAELCDVCLVVGACRVYAHKLVLSASSPYFRAMFTGELAESRQTQITIRDIDEAAMELLVDFCYTSRITVDERSVQTLLPAACILQVSGRLVVVKDMADVLVCSDRYVYWVYVYNTTLYRFDTH